jgi:hypothetical protein
MHNNDIIIRCRVCGLLQGEPPWGCDGKSPTYAFCSCCGVEFGYGDASPTAIRDWRQNWVETGVNWDDPKEKPANWDWREQLSHVADLQPIES